MPTEDSPTQIAERLAYSRRQGAVALGVSVPLVDRLIADGKIRSIKLGDRRLIPAEEINRVLKEGVQ